MRVSCIATLVLCSLMWTATPSLAQGVGDPAPDFTYTTLAGTELSLSDYEGKVVFLFLLGNTCPFCLSVGNRTETEVNAVYASTGNFQAIGLDLWNGSAASVEAFKEQTGVTYPLCLQAGSMANLYSSTYDRVIVIDQDGIIQYKGTTHVSSTLDDTKEVIDALLMMTPTGVEDEQPEAFTLHAAYPNPFNPSTAISYTLPVRTHVELRIYDLLGNEVRTLVDGRGSAGRQTVTWDGTNDAGHPVASGVYVIRMVATGPAGQRFTAVRKAVLLR